MQNPRDASLIGASWWERAAIAVLLPLALAARLVPGPRTIDDAFITFRYARNIVQGVGFVYNPGEAVLGTTTPLYTLWMAILALVTRSENYPLLALVTNALADAVSVYLLYHLGRRLSNSPLVGWAAALLWAISPMSVTFAIGGMETSVYILLMLATFTAHLERRVFLAAILAALALLTRPDAALIVMLIFISEVRTRTTKPDSLRSVLRGLRLTFYQSLPWILLLLAVLAPWMAFATDYFGSPLPQSVFAKSIAYRLPPEAGLGRLIQHLSVPFFESDVFDTGGLIRMIIYLALYLVAARAALRREPRSLPFFAYPLLYAIVFALANPLMFRWYLAPPLPGYMLGILLGIYQVSNVKSLTSGLAFEIRHLIVGLVAVMFAATSLNAWTLKPDHGPDRPAPKMAYIQLELLYHQVAADLKPQVRTDTVIAAGDIGALGYDTNARILDTLGLISPQTARYYPLDASVYVINYAMPPQLILDQLPDWIVSPEAYIRNGLLKDAHLEAQYQLFETLPTDIYGSNGLMVFRRK